MAKINKKIIIHAPVEKVYRFMVNPENWTRYVSGLVNVKDISSPQMEVGTTFKWTYRMLGVNFHGKGRITENIENRKFGLKMEGNFPVQETYSFAPVKMGAELSAEIEYKLPGKILSVIENNKLIEKLNKKEAENALAKVKMFSEAM